MSDECSGKPTTGSICWSELMTRDIPAAKKFYAEMFGWKLVDQDMGEFKYTMFTPPGEKEPKGGMMMMEGPQFEGVPPSWLNYIAVEDVDASAQRCVKLGGKIECPPTDIPKVGRFAMIADPTGAVIALYRSA
ncbi:MAG: VOC family protein [Planctomycetota bacterium]